MATESQSSDLAVEIEQVEAAYRDISEREFSTFVRGLVIPSASGPQLEAQCESDFQRKLIEDITPSLHAVRDGTMPEKRRFWIEYTKKAGKDSSIGQFLLWLASFPRRPLKIQVAAADQEQAGIVRGRIKDLLHYNPWLNDKITIQNNRVLSKCGLAQIEIIATDIAGAHGETPAVLVVNELSHIRKWEFVEAMLSNAAGVPQGLVIIATNAGFHGTKAETWRKNAIESPDWTVHVWDRPAPWSLPANVEDERRRLPPSQFKRLWYGQWVSGKGDALDDSDIDGCFVHGLEQLTKPEPGWIYVGGLDLGVSHDHAALVILGISERLQRIRLGWMRAWAPIASTGEVDLINVEDMCFAMHRLFRLTWLGYDPTQAKLMAQRLKRRSVPVHEVSFASPKNLTAMAQAIVQTVNAGKLECYDDDEGRLRRDLGKLSIVERGNGYKLEAVSDEHGHADVATALAIGLPKAVSLLGGIGCLLPEDDIASTDDEDLSETEISELPDELKDIYDAYDGLDEECSRSRNDNW